MTIRGNAYKVLDLIKPQHILVSVFDKAGLNELIRGILEVNPEAIFYSTGGTGKEIMRILEDTSESCFGLTSQFADDHYVSVENFTDAPEMEGGLVKTLHPKIHAGLLAERGNPAHEKYLFETMEQMTGTPGVYFDIFVGNLYPFADVVAKEGATAEDARINIDIGGPAMTMAAAKNWHSVAVITRPVRYSNYVLEWKRQGGTTIRDRFYLAQEAMRLIGEYRSTIGKHFDSLRYESDVLPTLNIAE